VVNFFAISANRGQRQFGGMEVVESGGYAVSIDSIDLCCVSKAVNLFQVYIL